MFEGKKKSLVETYEGQVIWLIGGTTQFLGKLIDHPSDLDRWFRVAEPCFIAQNQMKDGQIQILVLKYGMPTGDYEDYVDLYIPPEFDIEIRTLFPDGNIRALYEKQRARERTENIIIPGTEEAMMYGGHQGNSEKVRRLNQKRKMN